MTPHDELMALAGRWDRWALDALAHSDEDCGRLLESCAADLRALLDSDASRAMARDAWLPIESAPKSEALLLWNGDFLTIGLFNRTLNDFVDTCEHSGGIHFDEPPTHWRPLPAPPQAIDAAASGAGESDA